MYISKINITNFRNFQEKEVLFNDGVNVIIGHNNAGKSNLIKALSLVLDYHGSKRLDIDDFNQHIPLSELKSSPPKISVQLTISQSVEEDLSSDDLVTVGNWLTKLEAPYEAALTYEYFLPEKEKERYVKALEDITDVKKAWLTIKHEFIRLYTYKIFGADPRLQNVADSESLHKFDFQYLDAIRDVERDMFTGRNTLLRDVLDFFMDYEIKNDSTKTVDQRQTEIKQKKEQFSNKADDLLEQLQNRMEKGKKQILSYAEETGASFNKANPNFEGSISDVEMFSALKLIVQYETGISIPATHNGLGYNNLIFMSLLLAKMQVNSDGGYLGSNAKVFPILAIEEPEAHLHPAMQYKFLKFLRENKEVKKKVRQVFVTTHSPQITSAVSLHEIVCLHVDNSKLTIGYPGKVFSEGESGKKAEAYVQRFLDATKSDMLFAQKVIFVEGITEQLLLSIMANYVGKSLEDSHVAVINVGGRYFDYFLNLFDGSSKYTIPKKIACLTDRDHERKLNNDSNYKSCYPFEFNQDEANYNYKDHASRKIEKYKAHDNIRFFSQDVESSKTFEYDLILQNPSLDLMLTNSIQNRREIEELMKCYVNNESFEMCISKVKNTDENNRITEGLKSNISLNDKDKIKALIAARYLNSIRKGENALELFYALDNNIKSDESKKFQVPEYISDAIEWVCQ